MAAITTWLPFAARGRVGPVPFAPGERVLAAATADGAKVVATDRALYHRDARLGWERIARVTWEDGHGLVLTGWSPDTPPRTVLAVPSAVPLLALARERIAWTALAVTRVELGPRRTVRVAVRRSPGTGGLVWLVDGDPGPDLDAALARLRADLLP
ncbi:hypothetical protein [Micromonospora sp. CPCC 206061]|uniref:hypothetical protein n=1 Tax=Micromonospora sp. CPCC 206061 TaxID=3122410 RepID=UPI002FF09A2A